MSLDTIILTLMNNFATVYFFGLAMAIVFEKQDTAKVFRAVLYLLYFACLSTAVFLSAPPLGMVAIHLGWLFLISTRYGVSRRSSLGKKHSWLYRIICVTIIFFLMGAIEWLGYTACMALSRWFPYMENIAFRFSIEKLLALLLLQILSRFKSIRYGHLLKEGRSALVLLLPIVSVFLSVVVISDPETASLQQIIWISGLVLINVFVFSLLDQLAQLAHRNAMQELAAFEADSVQSYLSTIESYQEQAREIRHDVKQMAHVLGGYIAAGEKDKALGYLEQMGALADSIKPLCQSGNLDFDIPLNSLLQYAASQGIDVSLGISVPAKIDMAPLDLHRILSNLIINAIEANAGVPAGDKCLSVSITHAKDNLAIVVRNPFAGKLVQSGGTYLSRKKDMGHGYGLPNVQRIVENNYGGEMSVSPKDGVFEVSATLFAPEETSE